MSSPENITTWIGVVASGVSAVVMVATIYLRSRTKEKLAAIDKGTPEAARIVADAVTSYNLDTKKITKEQTFQLARDEIAARDKKHARILLTLLGLAIVVAITSVALAVVDRVGAPAQPNFDQKSMYAAAYGLGKDVASLAFYRSIGNPAEFPADISDQFESAKALATAKANHLGLQMDVSSLRYSAPGKYGEPGSQPPNEVSDAFEVEIAVRMKHGEDAAKWFRTGLELKACWWLAIGKRLKRGSVFKDGPWSKEAYVNSLNESAKGFGIQGIPESIIVDEDELGVRILYELDKFDKTIERSFGI